MLHLTQFLTAHLCRQKLCNTALGLRILVHLFHAGTRTVVILHRVYVSCAKAQSDC